MDEVRVDPIVSLDNNLASVFARAMHKTRLFVS